MGSLVLRPAAIGLLAALAVACGSDDIEPGSSDAALLDAPIGSEPDAALAIDAQGPDAEPTPARHHWVTNALDLPTSLGEPEALGFDLDGDGTVDNALGAALKLMADQGADAQPAADDAIGAGTLILLHSLTADDLVADDAASWRMLKGDPATPPDFTGAGTFSVAADSPTDAVLDGTIEAGRFAGGPGVAIILVPFVPGTTPVLVHLAGALLRADVGSEGCSGVVGGAITETELDTVVVPGLVNAMNERIAADCPGGVCTPDSTGQQLLALFDTDHDGTVTEAEVRDSPFYTLLFRPDLDLDGDGVPESVSMGAGFTCVPGQFEVPGE